MLRTVIAALEGMKRSDNDLNLEIVRLMRELGEKGVAFFLEDKVSLKEKVTLKANECLVITDSRLGVTTAKAAGMACIAYDRQEEAFSWEKFLGADLVVEGLEEVDYALLEKTWRRSKGLPCMIAEGTRIFLRELSEENLPAVCHLFQKYKRTAFGRKEEAENFEERFFAYRKTVYEFYDCGLWGIFHKKDKTLIGLCGLEPKERAGESRLELGYVLEPNWEGYGYATEATRLAINYGFKQLEIPAVHALIDSENEKSIHTAQRAGLKLVGKETWEEKNYLHFQISLVEWQQILSREQVNENPYSLDLF